MSSQTTSLIGRQLGDYQIDRLLGAGGMAEVYQARDLKLGRLVAVKVLPPFLAADSGYVERFRNEAQRVAALEHPNIVPVYTLQEEGTLLYLVMPMMQESLRDVLGRTPRMKPEDATRVVVQIASALQVAHEHGLVHRDVKPENILLNDKGEALLTDFGIARPLTANRPRTAQTLSATGLPVGTPEYMAPEHLRGEDLDGRADIYSLGSVYYEMLTGTVPFRADTPYEVAARALKEPVRLPSELNPGIWPELEEVIMKALAPAREERFANADEFATAAKSAASLTSRGLLSGMRRISMRTAKQSAPREDRLPKPQPLQRTLPMEMGVATRSRQRLLLLVGGPILLLAMLGVGFLGKTILDARYTDALRARPTPTLLPTITPLPTAVPTETPVPTATVRPISLLSFAAVKWDTPSRLGSNGICSGSSNGSRCEVGLLLITNPSGGRNVTATITVPQGPQTFRWDINQTPPSSTPPQISNIQLNAGTTTKLYISYRCISFDPQPQYSMSVVDSLGRGYTFQIQMAQCFGG